VLWILAPSVIAGVPDNLIVWKFWIYELFVSPPMDGRKVLPVDPHLSVTP
jgi:hypothetical protein